VRKRGRKGGRERVVEAAISDFHPLFEETGVSRREKGKRKEGMHLYFFHSTAKKKRGGEKKKANPSFSFSPSPGGRRDGIEKEKKKEEGKRKTARKSAERRFTYPCFTPTRREGGKNRKEEGEGGGGKEKKERERSAARSRSPKEGKKKEKGKKKRMVREVKPAG